MSTLKLTLIACFILMFSCDDAEPEFTFVQKEKTETKSVVFIAGIDGDDNMFYKNAKAYFSEEHITIVENISTVDHILLWLNTNADGKIYDKIHIVTEGNSWQGMVLDSDDSVQSPMIKSFKEVQFTKPNTAITANTDVIFYSYGVGKNKKFMEAFKKALASDAAPNVYASEHFNMFGSRFSPHYLAEPFYVFYASEHSPGLQELAREIAHKYPSADLDWLGALAEDEETTAGAVYSKTLNIPIKWTIVYDDISDIPELKNASAVMDFILENHRLASELYELGIPMEKFAWTSAINGAVLELNGETTVMCVLNPIMDSYIPAEHSAPDVTHPRLYTKF